MSCVDLSFVSTIGDSRHKASTAMRTCWSFGSSRVWLSMTSSAANSWIWAMRLGVKREYNCCCCCCCIKSKLCWRASGSGGGGGTISSSDPLPLLQLFILKKRSSSLKIRSGSSTNSSKSAGNLKVDSISSSLKAEVLLVLVLVATVSLGESGQDLNRVP